MRSEDLFLNQWTIWLTFVGQGNYDQNLKKMLTICSPAEIAYVLKNTPFGQTKNFLLHGNRQHQKYEIDNRWRRINSIEIFKKNIQPTWEDPCNKEGGRFIIQIPKSAANSEEIYQNMILFFLGEDFELAPKVNGIRFVSTKDLQRSCFRAEVWVQATQDNNPLMEGFKKLFIEFQKLMNMKLEENIGFCDLEVKKENKPNKG